MFSFLPRTQTTLQNYFRPELSQNAPPDLQQFVPQDRTSPTIGRTIRGLVGQAPIQQPEQQPIQAPPPQLQQAQPQITIEDLLTYILLSQLLGGGDENAIL